jgi:hypothetical protein
MSATTDPAALLAQAQCLNCYGDQPGMTQLIELSLLRQVAILQGVSVSNVSPDVLLAGSGCLTCYGSSTGTRQLIKLALLAKIAALQGVALASLTPDMLLSTAGCISCNTGGKGMGDLLGLALWQQIALCKGASLASVQADMLLANANCYSCYGSSRGMAELLELSLLTVIALAQGASLASVAPDALLAGAGCFNCYGASPGMMQLLELGLLTSIAATACQSGPYPYPSPYPLPYPVTPVTPSSLLTGLVAYWKLDEAAGNASDSSGNGNTLTNSNVVTYVPGLIGNAANFVGASSQQLITFTTLGLGVTTKYSTSQWYFRSATTNAVSSCFAIANANMTGNIWFTDGNLYNYIGSNANFGKVALGGSGSWTHIVNVYDGTQATNALKLLVYVNGVAQGLSFTGTIPASFTPPAEYQMGWNPSTAFATGLIDESGIWSRAITPAEVAVLYNGGAGKTYPFS